MKKLLFAALLISLSGMAAAQTSKRDTMAIPAPPKIMVKKFNPPVIAKDTLAAAGHMVKKQPGHVPPPPPLVILKDSIKRQ